MINDILNKPNKINNQSRENEKNKAKKLVIKIILIIALISIILIILSLVLNEELLQLENKEDSTDKLVVEIEDNNIDNIVQTKTNYNVEINVNKFGNLNEEVNKMLTNNIYMVVSENRNWNETQVINVFKNIHLENAIIAPGSYGTYKFDINNGLPDDVNYILKLKEENNKNINMQYKIKLNDKYIIEQWTKLEDITIPIFKIEPVTRARYVLEWKWIDSENDTNIGQDAAKAKYNICIDISR